MSENIELPHYHSSIYSKSVNYYLLFSLDTKIFSLFSFVYKANKGCFRARYVPTSDNKYIRYNLPETSFTVDVTKWQKVIDESGLTNNVLFKSLFSESQATKQYIKDDGTIGNADAYRLVKFQITEERDYIISTSGNPSHPLLSQFTDGTYTSHSGLLVFVQGKTDYYLRLHLQVGYYAMSWFKSATGYNNFISSEVDDFMTFMTEEDVKRSYGKNLFNTENALVGYYLNGNGDLVVDSDYSVTDFIKVDSNDYYLSAKNSTPVGVSPAIIGFYDSYKSLQSAYSITNKLIHVPNGICYVRISYLNNAEEVIFSKGETRINYIPFSNIGNDIDDIKERKIDIVVGKNLFNGKVGIADKYISSTGELMDSSIYGISEMIPVKEQTQYCLTADSADGAVGSYAVNVAFFNINNENVGYTTVYDKTFTTPQGTAYLQFSYNIALPNIMLNEGAKRGVYCPYTPLKLTDEIYNSVLLKNIVNVEDAVNNMYINDSGVITTGGAPAYYCLKFHLEETDNYLLLSKGSSHPILVRYTDNTYAVVSEIVASNVLDDFKYFGTLNYGYYALSWSKDLGNNDIVLTRGAILENILNQKNFGSKIQDFRDFEISNDGWTKNGSMIVSSAENTGLNYKINYPVVTYEDDFIMQAVVVPIADDSGNYEVVVGKYGLMGTALAIGKDANGKHVSVIRYDNNNDTLEEHLSQRIDISALRFDLWRPLTVVLRKKNDTLTYFILDICDSAGNVISIDRITGYEYPLQISDAGLGKGQLTIYTKTGQWQLRGISFGYEKDADDIKLVIAGHSFVEGNNSTTNDKDKRFSAMLAEDIGEKNCLIFGHGGAGVGMLDSVYHQIGWYKDSIRYALIMLGTNDPDVWATGLSMQYFNDKVKALGIKPIWLTVPPKRDGTMKTTIDNYIRTYFDFIDIKEIFLNADGTVNTDIYLDNEHPTIAGYQKMYNLIKASAPYFWEI